MRPNPVRTGLKDGTAVFGTFLMEFATPGVARLADSAGSQFVFWDLQHTGWSTAEVAPGIAAVHGRAIAAGVRVPQAVPWLIGQALDAGASLIMVPAVESPETAAEIVRATRYPTATTPDGIRPVTFNFGWDDFRPPTDAAAELEAANDDVVVFVQIETARGLDRVEQIAAVDGIDVLWVGDNDLAASLGVAGDFAHPVYLAALDRVAAAAATAGKAAGFTTADPAVAEDMLNRGYRVLAFGNDVKVFQAALRGGIDAFRALARK
ncbi:aldolase/citrate lyase family protein [Mycobacterium sp. 21AC1]|uniref:HpcH/HpaI aldolase family protein n=1 Tax=[Mycobacterium] appelbergii TaxID=2939269 RepID=UPI002939219E|nr:aldolase/citrate lyase family protein [Mycobacterium sp. 21AC1]MDV3129691.1 aldolase/citrate lyase family protein [Mycobacterium sp. 21AC1]